VLPAVPLIAEPPAPFCGGVFELPEPPAPALPFCCAPVLLVFEFVVGVLGVLGFALCSGFEPELFVEPVWLLFDGFVF